MTTLYGIHNCDTVKKTMKWLTANNIEFTFHDFRKDGLTASLLQQFFALSDWEALMNKRSTTFKNLPDEVKNNLNEATVFTVMLEQPTLIKRPVLMFNNQLTIGFKDSNYQEIFAL